MEVLIVKINRLSEEIYGIKLFENENILILINNPNDYVLDGITFINKKYVKKILVDSDEIKPVVFSKKETFFEFEKNVEISNFDSIKSFFNQLSKKELVELVLDSSDYVLIGKVLKKNEKSVRLSLISTKGKIYREETFRYEKIRAINIRNDYLKSLNLYINS